MGWDGRNSAAIMVWGTSRSASQLPISSSGNTQLASAISSSRETSGQHWSWRSPRCTPFTQGGQHRVVSVCLSGSWRRRGRKHRLGGRGRMLYKHRGSSLPLLPSVRRPLDALATRSTPMWSARDEKAGVSVIVLVCGAVLQRQHGVHHFPTPYCVRQSVLYSYYTTARIY